jgi:hypothetical protein
MFGGFGSTVGNIASCTRGEPEKVISAKRW